MGTAIHPVQRQVLEPSAGTRRLEQGLALRPLRALQKQANISTRTQQHMDSETATAVAWIHFRLGGVTAVWHVSDGSARQHVSARNGSSMVTAPEPDWAWGSCWGDRCYATTGSLAGDESVSLCGLPTSPAVERQSSFSDLIQTGSSTFGCSQT